MFFNQLMSYVTYPLVLVGLFLTLVLLLVRYLMAKEMLPPWPATVSAYVPRPVLAHLYVVGLLVVFLGLVLKHSEMRGAAHENAVRMLLVDFEYNQTSTQAMADNLQVMRQSFAEVSQSLREADSEIMQLMFPAGMIPPAEDLNIGKKVEAAFAAIKSRQLFDNPAAMQAFKAEQAEIRPLVTKQLQALDDAKDVNGRFLMRNDNQLVYEEVLAEVNGLDLVDYDASFATMKSIRGEYNRVFKLNQNYLSKVQEFLERNTFISNGDVYDILVQEQQTYVALNQFGEFLQQRLPNIKNTDQKLTQLLRDLADD